MVIVREITDDKEVLNSARMTVWKDALEKQPSEKFMYDIYMSEHSPIRDKMFTIEIYGIKSWVATHLARHSVGYTPYIATQRDDRTPADLPRDEIGQGALVNMRITLNAQAFINVSKKRLCKMSHKETVKVWKDVIENLKGIDPILAHHCVPNCIYRNGLCPEPTTCKWNFSSGFKTELKVYISHIEDRVSVK